MRGARGTVLIEGTKRRMLSQFQKGIGLLVLVALIWVVSSFVVQDILTEQGFGRAFFLTFLANSLFSVNIPFLYVLQRFRMRRQKKETRVFKRRRSVPLCVAVFRCMHGR